jgi:hypothetical protein
MSPVPKSENQAVPRGLVAVAFLKARFDERVDHLEMFMPLIVDSLDSMAGQSFTTAELQSALGLPSSSFTTATRTARPFGTGAHVVLASLLSTSRRPSTSSGS